MATTSSGQAILSGPLLIGSDKLPARPKGSGNAFVQGVSESFAHLPPPKAASPDGALPQLVKGLQKGAGPPKAQPQQPAKPARVSR